MGDLAALECPVTQGLLQSGDTARSQGELATGIDLDCARCSDGLPGGGHEAFERLDLVAEEFRAHGMSRVTAEDIEDAAAYREHPWPLGGLLALVSHARKKPSSLVQVDRMALREHERLEDVAAMRRNDAHECAGRGHDNDRARLGERVQRAGATRHDFHVGRSIGPRQVGALGEVEDVAVGKVRGGLPRESLRGLLAGDDDQCGPRPAAHERGDQHGTDEP